MEGAKHVNELHKLVDLSNKLIFEQYRLQTFNTHWKELKGFKHCTPKSFATAGFYNVSSTQFPDSVKCFACMKELSDWEKEDDPWHEHVKRGSQCPFVLFKLKETTTVRDFLQLHYEIKKIIINKYFDIQLDVLRDKEKVLLETVDQLLKNKK